jgi:hypothetical protein
MSHRRSKIGKFPAYDFEYDLRKGKSGILNRQNNSSLAFDLWSEAGQRKLLTERIGEEDGQIVDPSGYWTPGLLLAAEMAVAAVDTRFENMVIKAKRMGRYPPETMPPELVNDKLILEARLDIVKEEVDQLKKMLAKHAARKQEENDHLILAQGPQGTTWGSDPPREVDHQPIRWDEKQGHFVIDCKKSPYDGVRLPDYYAFVCKPWREAKNAAYQEAHKKATNLDLSEGERRRFGERAAQILRSSTEPPWPPRPERF